MRYRVGIDIGGTFTDGVVIDEGGNINIFKDPSTPQNPSIGLFNCLKKAATHYGLPFRDFLKTVDQLVLGTTVATNAMLEYNGAKLGIICTKGFRDTIEMRRGYKEDIWDLSLARPPMIAPRHSRLGVIERLDYKGDVLVPLDEEDTRRVVRKMKEMGVEAIAVCTLFSYVNDAHERRIKEIAHEEHPEAYVSISSEILRQVREYERLSTTAVNAYLGPILSRYLADLRRSLQEEGLPSEFLVMQSNGGVMTVGFAAEHAVNAVLSGPSGGAVGGLFFCDLLDMPNLIVTDMGGTSFDVTLIKDDQYSLTTEGQVANYRVALPVIDIHTIGAGGGSVAEIDEAGLLKVGPKSAKAVPGPACYRKGGTHPTVTDANLALGYLNPDYFLGGEIKLDREASLNAIREHIAEPLGLDTVQAANGIFKLVNSNMADAIKVVSIQKGHDPREFVLVAAGGAGPAHASKLAAEVGIPRVVVPKASSVFCALGMLESDLKHDYVRTFWSRLQDADIDKLNSALSELENQGRQALTEEGTRPENIRIEKSIDMRYVGQHHEITVPVPGHQLTQADLEETAERFHQAHQRLYLYNEPEKPIETVNVRLTAIGLVPKTPIIGKPLKDSDSSSALKNRRKVFFEDLDGLIDTPVYDGSELEPGNVVEGPAIVEEVTTTTVVFPRDLVRVDSFGNLIIEVNGKPAR